MVTREWIAQIIDPATHWQRENTKSGKRIYAVHWNEALEKADAILAALPAQEGQDIVKIEDAIMQAWLDFDARTGRELAHRGMAEIAAKAVAAISPAQEWQDISTAPKDGTKILVCHKTRRDVIGIETARWGKDNWLNVLNLCIENPYIRFADILARTITHWQPLPEPPVAVIAEERGT